MGVGPSGLLLEWVQDSASKVSFLLWPRATASCFAHTQGLGRLAWQYLGSMMVPQGSLQFPPWRLTRLVQGQQGGVPWCTHTLTRQCQRKQRPLWEPLEKAGFLATLRLLFMSYFCS